jgi:hypothetical protein
VDFRRIANTLGNGFSAQRADGETGATHTATVDRHAKPIIDDGKTHVDFRHFRKGN